MTNRSTSAWGIQRAGRWLPRLEVIKEGDEHRPGEDPRGALTSGTAAITYFKQWHCREYPCLLWMFSPLPRTELRKCFPWDLTPLLRSSAELWQVPGQKGKLQPLCITDFCCQVLQSLWNIVQLWQLLLCCWHMLWLGYPSGEQSNKEPLVPSSWTH